MIHSSEEVHARYITQVLHNTQHRRGTNICDEKRYVYDDDAKGNTCMMSHWYAQDTSVQELFTRYTVLVTYTRNRVMLITPGIE